MKQSTTELVLQRVFDYLVDSNIALTNDVNIQVLALVEEGLRFHAEELLSWVMAQIPGRFGLTYPVLPAVQPELLRGSIGYGYANED